MPRNKFVSLLLIFIFCAVCSDAQTRKRTVKLSETQIKEKSKEADGLFKKKEYQAAWPIYLQLVTSKPGNGNFNYKAGVSCLFANADRAKAIEYLTVANEMSKKPDDFNYHLALANMYAGNADKAIQLLEEHKATLNEKEVEALGIDRQMEWIMNGKEFKSAPNQVTFKNMGPKINTKYSEFGPRIAADDSLMVFSSKRNTNNGFLQDYTGEYTTDVYMSVIKTTASKKVRNIGINVNTPDYEEVICLSPDGERLYFMRDGTQSVGDIYFSELRGKTWQKSRVLSNDFQTKQMETGATISPNGKWLIFSSDRKGGQGGMDLYMCSISETGAFGEPKNLGPKVNTPFDEDNPIIHIDSKTLFFSSDGHKSMGGADIFKTYLADPKVGWSVPENLGYPINNAYDNLYFAPTADGKKAYVSAVREDTKGSTDIYEVNFEKPYATTNIAVVKGLVLAPGGTPSKSTRILITDKETGKMVANTVTNSSSGKFIAFLKPGSYEVLFKTRKLGQFNDSFVVGEEMKMKVNNIKFQMVP
ncbi:MAG: hypothetical protein HKN75_02065 [Bacteroidia bacterium]|nr:hypothetical protein [Bacteroidia bacterium]